MKKLISVFLLIFLVACTAQDDLRNRSDVSFQHQTLFEPTQNIKKFESQEDVVAFLDSMQSYDSYQDEGIMRSEVFMAMDTVQGFAPAAESAVKSATDYSATNVQVEGVDEADFVKNDDKYIYILSGNNLIIVDAYPAEDAEILSETYVKGNPTEMFVNEDKLVVFSSSYENVYMIPEYEIMPRPIYRSKTYAYLYDVSNREKPELIKTYDVNGNYYDARMIGDYVYMVVQDSIYRYGHYLDLPVIRTESKLIISPEIFYFDNPDTNFNFNTVMSLDLRDGDVEAKTFLMGYANTMYVSENSIYIAYQQNFPYRYYQEDKQEEFYDVILPMLPKYVQDQIDEMDRGDYSSYERWELVSNILEDMFNEMGEDEKDDFLGRVEEAVAEHQIMRERERRKTIIHKIKIAQGGIEYDNKGEVPGYLLNQFSMDEDGDYFRVATTLNLWAGGQQILYNNVYVLDQNMRRVGELEDIAPDESIYATRFIGDRLYMVTFRQVDPFFVIDLADPSKPKILGKLKIPGFSNYLHPYDENHIIGIGKETKENEWGGVTTEGIKLALFDVSDVENPRLVDKYEIGESGSDSEVLRDHKALLFDKEKNLLVLPVYVVKGRYMDDRYHYYRYRTWQGAYVFTITKDGFELKGKVAHDEQDLNYWYYYAQSGVRRALYMDEVLYTVSNQQIKMNYLENLDEINEIKWSQINIPKEIYI